jgi:putative tryptophan/tyrosine transport system substrate-binding protein
VAILYRFADDQVVDRLPELAADLVRRNVAAIATGGPAATFAARAATATIPIMFLVADDPVRLGLTESLSRPGSNMTGINVFNAEVAAKRLELLRDLVPGVTRIAVFVNRADATMMETQLRDVDTAARAMGLHIQKLDANTSAEIDAAFKAFGRERPDAVFVPTSPFFNGRRVQLAQLAAFHHLPATYALRDYAEVGGLMSYGSNTVEGYRQVGIYVGRVLKGAKPADLPIVQANKFELVINMQTARMLDLVVPPSLLAIADEVIE